MPLAGFMLPAVSAFDPPVAAEGSLDPLGLGVISERLAELLVSGVRARMSRVRFVTAMAVGALACEPLREEPSQDGVSTPAICFEWLLVEAFVRRLDGGVPQGVPGSLKARIVVGQRQRLAAATYLKAPAVFGFHGVYKPFAIDSRIVGEQLEPGPRCAEVVRCWEQDQDLSGFVDEAANTPGAKLRARIHDEVKAALRSGRCVTTTGSHVFGQLAWALRPDQIGARERRALRSLLSDDSHKTRAELARLVAGLDHDMTEVQLLEAIRPQCSPALGAIVDAVVAYEQFAAPLDAAFRTLCAMSRAYGSQPVTPGNASGHDTIVYCATQLPGLYRRAVERIGAVSPDAVLLEQRLGEFAIQRTPVELVALLVTHHEQVQAGKPPNGKRPWFEPVADGWVVRGNYRGIQPPPLGPRFVHPVRVAPLHRFMQDTADE